MTNVADVMKDRFMKVQVPDTDNKPIVSAILYDDEINNELFDVLEFAPNNLIKIIERASGNVSFYLTEPIDDKIIDKKFSIPSYP